MIILKRITYLTIAGILALSLNGCMVAESTYLKKVEETDNLTREFGDLKQKDEKLTTENNTLKNELATQLKSKEELEQLLKAKSDMLSQSVSDLRQKIAALETENKELLKARDEKVKEASTIYEKLLQDLKDEISQGQVNISELKGKLTINLEAATFFDSGKTEIKPDGLTVLRKTAETLKGIRDRMIRIEGHTDNLAIATAPFRILPTNWELSAARVINIATYFQHQGIDPAVLSAVTFSEYKPAVDAGLKEKRARNHRIQITLQTKD